ncbi:hypothetical protein BEL04_19370 [Mucilaginibacter sp. PPCGB 2223]|nr:hypothetical protein BEL04_19370 [Mucilaginibacter sp. PPCGB 2223]
MKDLIGKWKQTKVWKGKDTIEYLFVNDTTFVIKDVNGYYAYVNRYRFDFGKDQIILTNLHKDRNGDDITMSLKFINDHTLVYKTLKVGSHDNTRYPEYTGTILTKVDNKDYSDFINPTLLTLRGLWRHDRYNSVNFINDTLAALKDGGETSELYNYTADFTKFPYWVDFKSSENKIIRHGLLIFATDSTMIFETFKGNSIKDDFTTFGRYMYIKLDSARKARLILKRAHQN